MSFQAFEVSVNGQHVSTAGAEDWRQIWCNVLAHRTPPELLPSPPDQDTLELPDEPIIGMLLFTHLSVIVDKRPRSEAPNDITKSGTFPRIELKGGDVIQIKIIETDSADEPVWQDSNDKGHRIIRSAPKSDPE